jgi:hypothetical protein
VSPPAAGCPAPPAVACSFEAHPVSVRDNAKTTIKVKDNAFFILFLLLFLQTNYFAAFPIRAIPIILLNIYLITSIKLLWMKISCNKLYKKN